jgi:hypothetical protein
MKSKLQPKFLSNYTITVKEEPLKVEFKKVFYLLPACFFAGIIVGIALRFVF